MNKKELEAFAIELGVSEILWGGVGTVRNFVCKPFIGCLV